MNIPKHNKRFEYVALESITLDNGVRHYMHPETKEPIASVTTILSETSNKDFLELWKKRIGVEKAEGITKLSGTVGSHEHNFIEQYLKGTPIEVKGNYARQIGAKIAKIIIEKGLVHCSEFWGSEVNLYYDNLFAGTTDLVGIYKNEESVMDFKNTRQPKKEEHIENYKCQVVAYGEAHNKLFGTNIKQGVILMANREQPNFGTFQEFVVKGDDWQLYSDRWNERLVTYYESLLAKQEEQ